MGLVFHLLSDPDSPKELVTYISKTTLCKEVIWLWKKFWDWGSLAWVIFSFLFPTGSGVAAVYGMYSTARILISVGCFLLAVKVIEYAATERKPKKTTGGIVWVLVITAILASLVAWGGFSLIRVIEWKNEMAISMTFKSSPALTEDRQHSIQWELNKYYLYLKKVGFQLPTDIPPLGLNPPRGIVLAMGPPLGPTSTHSIYIPEDVVDDFDNVRFAYSTYTFNRLLTWPDMLKTGLTRAEAEHDEVAAWIAECYFPASFSGHLVCEKGTPGYKWTEALWEVRSQLGQDYADGLVCYTVNLWGTVPSKYVGDFDRFFRYRLAGGESVKGNANTGRQIDAIFKRHGLDISPPW